VTNEEIICEWMEPRPTKSWAEGYQPFDPATPPCPWRWWYWDGMASIYGGAARPRLSDGLADRGTACTKSRCG
jgi:hypothetical protein